MMINVSGSLSVINKVGKSLEGLNLISEDLLHLEITSDLLNLDFAEEHDKLNIRLINLDATPLFYQKLIGINQPLSLTVIDNGSTHDLSKLFIHNQLTTRSLGLQAHCFKGDINELPEQRIFRLKDIRQNPDISEIVLRTSDAVIFNMNAIRRGDQCGSLRSNTTGFSIEEACLIAKFIGASDLIQQIFIVGLNLNDDVQNMMSTNVANLLWYINDGAKLRQLDQNILNDENLVFSVVAESVNHELQFIKSASSGRWWIKVPTEDGYMHMACSKKDYEMACNNEISERITQALESVI